MPFAPAQARCSNRLPESLIQFFAHDVWTETFGSQRLTGAPLDRLTHHIHILEMNGESFRLNHSRARKKAPAG